MANSPAQNVRRATNLPAKPNARSQPLAKAATPGLFARARAWGWKWTSRLLAAALLAGVVVGTLGIASYCHQRFWSRSQQAHFERLPSEHVLTAVRALAAEGPHALPELVAALGSTQASVATAAQQVVLEELVRFESQRSTAAARGGLLLSESLAAQAPRFGPTMTQFVSHLAERLLRGDHETLSSAERLRLIDACGVVIRHASREVDVSRLARNVDLNWEETPPAMPWEASLALTRGAEEKKQRESSLADFGSAGVEPEGVEVPSLPDAALATKEPDARLSPKPLPGLTGAEANPTYAQPEKFRKPLELRRLPKRNEAELQARETKPDGATDSQTPRLLSPRESAARRALPRDSSPGRNGGAPRDETMIRLLQDLVDADEQAANRAATALAERGLPSEHLELARRLGDPDPNMRKSLVEILPRTPGLNARPWLMWLAHDEHAEVRLAAMTTLATSRDPLLCDTIEQLARQDNDPRILALAERLAKRRGGK